MNDILKNGQTGLENSELSSFLKYAIVHNLNVIDTHYQALKGLHKSSVVTQMVENLPAMWETRDSGLIPGLGRSPGDGNGNPFQCSYLGIPWTEEPGELQSAGSQRIGHD